METMKRILWSNTYTKLQADEENKAKETATKVY